MKNHENCLIVDLGLLIASSNQPDIRTTSHRLCTIYSFVVTAGTGTGKTHMLAERYVYYLREKNLSPALDERIFEYLGSEAKDASVLLQFLANPRYAK